jgi:hypothetical protein
MENKSIKINVPEGFEIDKDKSSFEEIVFKIKQDINKEMSDFLFKIVNGCMMKMTDENKITYYKDDEWILQQDFKKSYLWIRYSLIWEIFEKKYALNYQQIKNFIVGWVETNLNWKGLTPRPKWSNVPHEVETNLN